MKVLGHDAGAMMAYAWAATHRDTVTHLGFLDALLPGASLWDGIFADPMAWHLKVDMNRDMPESARPGTPHHPRTRPRRRGPLWTRLVDVLREFAKDVTGGSIPDCGHWVVEERPGAVLAALDTF